MRSLDEVRNDYTKACSQIGDLEVRKQQLMEQMDAQLEPLHNKCRDLQREGEQIIAIQKAVEAASKQPEPPTES
jgi:tryptophanyl-tRNA synthetase